MPEDSEVGEILRNNRSEVVSMCLEEYTQEYVDELHKIELDRFKKIADNEKIRADEAENQICRNVVTMLKDQMSDEMILRYTGISPEKLQEIKEIGGADSCS